MVGGPRTRGARRPEDPAGAARDLRTGFAGGIRATLTSQRSPSGFSRTLLLRRVAAAALVATAVALVLRGDPGTESVGVVVAAHDLAPGNVLVDGDIALVRRPAHAVPEGTVPQPAAAVDRVVAAPMRAGEAVTDVRLLGTALARAAAGVEDARLVTVRLADPALADIVRAGDLVDVIAAPDRGADAADAGDVPAGKRTHPAAITLAERAPVVLVPPPGDARSRSGRVLLIALPARKAARVATASMTHAMTVTVR